MAIHCCELTALLLQIGRDFGELGGGGFYIGPSKNEIHFGLPHLPDVFGVGSQLSQSLTAARSNVKCLGATTFSSPVKFDSRRHGFVIVHLAWRTNP